MEQEAVHTSYTFTLSGKSSELSCNFNPPIYLNESGRYELALLNFETFNSLANVDKSNNILQYEDKTGTFKNNIEIPVGTYDIDDIAGVVNEQLQRRHAKGVFIDITGNNNTQHVRIKSTRRINFACDNSIGSLLGFKPGIVPKHTERFSDYVVNINKTNALQIYCNLVTGSYNNGVPVHVLYHFFPNVPAGFKIIESPQQPIYLPVSTNVISSVTVRILDQDGKLVDFREEELTVRVHLKSIN